MNAWQHVRAVVRRTSRHEVSPRAAALGMFALLALFPLLLSLVGLLPLLHLDAQLETLTQFVRESLPGDQASLVIDEMARLDARSGAALWIGLVVTTYYASRVVTVILRGVAAAYGREVAKPWRTRVAGTVFAAAGIGLVLVLFLALGFTSSVVQLFVRFGFAPTWLTSTAALHPPILAAVSYGTVVSLYRLGAGPAWVGVRRSLGAVCATAVWLALARAFEWYVTGVSHLGATYGSLGATVGLLVYFHWASMALFIGAEIDAHFAALRAATQPPDDTADAAA